MHNHHGDGGLEDVWLKRCLRYVSWKFHDAGVLRGFIVGNLRWLLLPLLLMVGRAVLLNHAMGAAFPPCVEPIWRIFDFI
jgi:hypothetical protein